VTVTTPVVVSNVVVQGKVTKVGDEPVVTLTRSGS